MTHKPMHRLIAAAALCCAVLIALPPAALGAGASDTIDDAWLGRIATKELELAVRAETWDAPRKRLRKALLARLACGPVNDETLTRLVFALRGCDVLETASQAAGKTDLAPWLMKRPEVRRRFIRAVDDVRKPAQAVARLAELVDGAEKSVAKHPDLAVAFATAEPLKHYRDQPNPATLLESFRYYTESKVRFATDVGDLPYESARYLADTRLSLAERAWAAKHYARMRTPAKAYFDLDYDYDHFSEGKDKKIADKPYSLMNLKKVGGVCIEQAYYAAEICKALGVPATIVHGRGGGGVHHAWFAYLKQSRGRSIWDSRTGRYESQSYFLGWLRDPARGKMLDSELMLYGAASDLSLARRESSWALHQAALLAATHDPNDPVDANAALLELARAHDKLLADADTPKADTSWIGRSRAVDMDVVQELLKASVKANLAHRPAWDTLAELRKEDRIPVDDLGDYFDTLIDETAKRYPDFSYVMVMRIVPTVDDADRRIRVYQRAMRIYRRRPDLQGRILLAVGDDYLEKQDDKPKALAAYTTAARRCVKIADVVIKAARKAEDLYSTANRTDLAIKLYHQLWKKTSPPRQSGPFARQTSYYQLGARLAFLLDMEGETDDAQAIRKRIGMED